MSTFEVRTQAELDAAVAKAGPDDLIACLGDGWFTARGSSHVLAWESSHVEARESSHVEAWESSHVEAWESSHVEAWGSSHVVARESSHVVARGSSHVEAWESSHVVARESSHVEAWGSSHVEAWESSHVVARGSSHVEASKYVSIQIHRKYGSPIVKGGVQIEIPAPDTMERFCDLYGVPVVDGVATFYKGVDEDYSTSQARPKDIFYRPGSQPEAPDWNSRPACGGGLHFSPSPRMTHAYANDPVHYLACPVAIADAVVVEPGYGADKIKAPRVCGPLVEVDVDGEPIAVAPVAKPKRARKAAAKA